MKKSHSGIGNANNKHIVFNVWMYNKVEFVIIELISMVLVWTNFLLKANRTDFLIIGDYLTRPRSDSVPVNNINVKLFFAWLINEKIKTHEEKVLSNL